MSSGELNWHLSFTHHKLKHFILLALPLMLGQSIVILDEQFIRIFGSMAEEGAVSLLSYARRVMMVPVGVVAQAVGVASFPFLATLVAKNDKIGFQKALNSALANSIIIIIPISCFMFVLAEQILGFIFEGGQFSANETALAAPLLQFMLLAVPFWAIQQIIGRAFYAHENTLTPTLIGSAVTLFSLPFYFYFSPLFGASAIAAIASISIMLYAACLSFFALKKFLPELKSILCLFLKNILLCLIPMWVSSLFILPSKNILFLWTENWLMNYMAITHFIIIIYCGIIFSITYLILAKLFLPTNFNLLVMPLTSYFAKKKKMEE